MNFHRGARRERREVPVFFLRELCDLSGEKIEPILLATLTAFEEFFPDFFGYLRLGLTGDIHFLPDKPFLRRLRLDPL